MSSSEEMTGAIDTLSGLSELTQKEKTSVLSAFPEIENEVEYIFRGCFRDQQSVYENGLIAVSPHFIVAFNQKSAGYSFSKIALFHILTMKRMESNNAGDLIIETTSGKMLHIMEASNDLVRIIFRNYSFATFLLPDSEKITVEVTNRNLLPRIKIPLSLTQMIQFRFAALCTQYDQQYDESIIRYLHSLLSHSNAIVELSRIPDVYHEPLLMSIVDVPGICGISANSVDIPYILKNIVSYVERAKNLRFLRIDNCNCSSGLVELGEAISANEQLALDTLIIANDNYEVIMPFIQSLSTLKGSMKKLSVSSINMGSDESEAFLDILCSNPAFSELESLGIGSIKLGPNGIQKLSEYFQRNKNLKRVDLSGSSGFDSLIKTISGTTIREVCLARCDFSDTSIAELISLAPNITSCDVSGSNIDVTEVRDVISGMGKNVEGAKLSVMLNEIDFSEMNICHLIRGFLLSDLSRWESIELNETKLKEIELSTLCALFMNMPELKHLSFESNFGVDDAKHAKLLLHIPTLRSLSLANCRLGSLASDFAAAEHIKMLNLADNELTDEEALEILSGDFEILGLADNEFEDIIEIENRINTHFQSNPLSTYSLEVFESYNKSAAEVLCDENIFVHSCVCEDLNMGLPRLCSVDVKNIDLTGGDAYALPHLNSVFVENGREFVVPERVCEMPKVTVTDTIALLESDSDHDFDSSEALHTNIIPDFTGEMFTGLGGEISDSSDDEDINALNSRLLMAPAFFQEEPPIDNSEIQSDEDEADDDEIEIVRTVDANVRHKEAPELIFGPPELEEEEEEEDQIQEEETENEPESVHEEECSDEDLLWNSDSPRDVRRQSFTIPRIGSKIIDPSEEEDQPIKPPESPQLRLFGSISEESQSGSGLGLIKKKVPPPPADRSRSPAAKFLRINTSLISSFRTKPTSETLKNPLLLAFSPPTLSRSRK